MNFRAQHLTKLICILLFVVQIAGSYLCAEVPAFVNESIHSSNKANVLVIDHHFMADLVILDGGLEQGLRLGMVCLIERGAQTVGELIIIESGSNCSAALILNLTKNLIIQPGDCARIKTFQNS